MTPSVTRLKMLARDSSPSMGDLEPRDGALKMENCLANRKVKLNRESNTLLLQFIIKSTHILKFLVTHPL